MAFPICSRNLLEQFRPRENDGAESRIESSNSLGEFRIQRIRPGEFAAKRRSRESPLVSVAKAG